ncbi:PREDICTED: putative glycerol kinase 5 [Priapulus caudatus]|uniref:Glycerol kinase 5 n=1 Tax=Priapulus caudatus TaxID=37621 RepID=A0ABM1ETU8_PRICU|nr:PREDICTED: putative glycerol kinase 5 [Priapulus caudatus]
MEARNGTEILSGDIVTTLPDPAYILAIDIGTTTLRSHVYNANANVVGIGSKRIQLLYPQPGWVEMDEEVFYQQFIDVVKISLERANITAADVTSLGISTQRNTFITWDRETGKPFHRLITWKDTRFDAYCHTWNNCVTVKALRAGSRCLYSLTRNKRYLATTVFQFKTETLPIRLRWLLDHNAEMNRRSCEGQVMFGTIETWLLWKLTGGKKHLVDWSSASSTLLFDPYLLQWSSIILRLVGLPMDMLPRLVDTAGDFGETLPEVFGAPIKVAAMVGDQQAAMFGECCFAVGDVKCTMGTGTFIDINTGSNSRTSRGGLYPLVGWKMEDEVVYLAEGGSADTGTAISWAQDIGLFAEARESSAIAESVKDSNGVFFIPSFSGLQAPVNDAQACAGFLGLSSHTTKAHMVRSLLESLAFRIKQLFETIVAEATFPVGNMRDGEACQATSFLLSSSCRS